MRKIASLSEEFVVHPIGTRSVDTDESVGAEIASRGPAFTGHLHVIVFPAGDRTLAAAIDHERLTPSWGEKVRQVAKHVSQALAHLHECGVVHGDLKPRNFVRVGDRFKLIDLDAAAIIGRNSGGDGAASNAFGAASPYSIGTDQVGTKCSTAFSPPELLEARMLSTSSIACATASGALLPPLNPTIKGHPSFDVWSLGATLYEALTGKTLVNAERPDDNAASLDLVLLLATWADAVKEERLSHVKDVTARHLLYLLLHRDPAMRPSMEHVLQHPFITGLPAVRLSNQPASFDVFLSYRESIDLHIACELDAALAAAGVNVWWDKRPGCLEAGKNWIDFFCSGLANSRCFIPILSRGAINAPGPASDGRAGDPPGSAGWNWSALQATSPCDNVLLEHLLALEFEQRGLIERICPVFVGDETSPGAGEHTDYLKTSNCVPVVSALVVEKVASAAKAYLSKLNLGSPLLGNLTAQEIHRATSSMKQGFKIEGNRAAAISRTVAEIVRLLRALDDAASKSAPLPPPPSPSPVLLAADAEIAFLKACLALNTSEAAPTSPSPELLAKQIEIAALKARLCGTAASAI